MNQEAPDSNDSKCSLVMLSSALAIAIIAGLAFVLALTISQFSPSPAPADLSKFTQPVASAILPEPTERRVFQLMVLLAPIIVLLSNSIVQRVQQAFFFSSALVRWGYLTISLLMLVWVNSWAYWPDYMLSAGLGSFSFVFPIVTGLILIGFAYRHTSPLQWMDTLIRKHFTLILTIILGTFFLIAVSFRVFDWKMLLNNLTFAVIHDLNPVLYYASLAETGNYSTCLGAPQYGFYSFYLKPVFRVIGLTIYSFSLVMTVLYLLGIIAIAVPIYRNLQNIYLKLLLIPALCALQGGLIQVHAVWDPYFQYYPIRFIVPALSVLMLYMILRTKKENIRFCLMVLSSFLLGFLVFWNFDSGIVTIIAWLGFFLLLAAAETFKCRSMFNPESLLFLAVAGMLALGVGVAGFILFTCDKSGLSFARLFEMQRVFYLTGFNMLPIPRSPHPWMAVAGVYVVTLVLTLPVILRTGLQCSTKRMLGLYIAIIGIGLFTYYQGRSHDRVLPAVIWPAIFCCFLACDWCLSVNSAKRLSLIMFLTLPFLILSVSLTVKLAWNFPWYFNRIILLHQELATNELTTSIAPISYTFDSLSEYRNEAPDSVLIIHPAESVYYVESGLHPLPLLSSEQERFFLRKQETDMQNIIRSGTVRHLFINPILIQTPRYEKIAETIRSKYKLVETIDLMHWILKEQ